MSLWHKEFPNFPDMPEPRLLMDRGFTDRSWHNDAAPTFLSPDRELLIWVNHPDPDEWEMKYRFVADSVRVTQGGDEVEYKEMAVYKTNSWEGLQRYLDTIMPAAAAEDGVWEFNHGSMMIRNPTITECGRFPISPSYYGFRVIGTGGGCTGWYRKLTTLYSMLITEAGGCSHEYGDQITVGVYNDETGETVCTYDMKVKPGYVVIVPESYTTGDTWRKHDNA